MKILQLKPYLTAFYLGGETEPVLASQAVSVRENWALGSLGLGMACYVMHHKGKALVYDTLCSPEQAGAVRAYLQDQLGVEEIIVVLSHWHLDHIGGNDAYRDCRIISCAKTRQCLAAHRAAIEAGTLWGEPAINPLPLPQLTFEGSLRLDLNGLEIQVHNLNIHSEDSACVYLPDDKLLLPGDMLEDTAPYIVNPQDIPAHLANLEKLRALDSAAIFPNHGRSFVIGDGGYPAALIDCTGDYLGRLFALLRDNPRAEVPDLQTFSASFLRAGLLHYWPPYEAVHANNIAQVRSVFA